MLLWHDKLGEIWVEEEDGVITIDYQLNGIENSIRFLRPRPPERPDHRKGVQDQQGCDPGDPAVISQVNQPAMRAPDQDHRRGKDALLRSGAACSVFSSQWFCPALVPRQLSFAPGKKQRVCRHAGRQCLVSALRMMLFLFHRAQTRAQASGRGTGAAAKGVSFWGDDWGGSSAQAWPGSRRSVSAAYATRARSWRSGGRIPDQNKNAGEKKKPKAHSGQAVLTPVSYAPKARSVRCAPPDQD